MKFIHFFSEDVPEYLSRHFWWAYLWPRLTPFFDHPLVINSILMGQYRRLKQASLQFLSKRAEAGRMLQLTCVYGDLTTDLMEQLHPEDLYIADVVPLQLDLARRKAGSRSTLYASRMNAEQLAFKDDCFATLVVFFLLHELPSESRQRVLSECLRVLEHDGELLVTEYAEQPNQHLFSRSPVARKILYRAEPFLQQFQSEDLLALLNALAEPMNQSAKVVAQKTCMNGFYRCTLFRLSDGI